MKEVSTDSTKGKVGTITLRYVIQAYGSEKLKVMGKLLDPPFLSYNYTFHFFARKYDSLL